MFIGNGFKNRDVMVIERVSKNIFEFTTGKGFRLTRIPVRIPKSEVIRMCKEILREVGD